MSAVEGRGVTDVHAHLLMPGLHAEVERRVPDEVQAAADLELRRNGLASIQASGRMIGERFPRLTSVDARLAAMDAQGVERQWVSPSPNHFYPWANEGLATWTTGEANRLIAEHVAQAPDRLVGLGTVPLQHPHLVVDALDDAVLGRGLAGVEISSFAGDVELSDDRLEAFWARAAELRAVVFLHPFGCSLDERLDRFYLSNTVGQPTENAVALSHLIFAGVLDRHPGLRLVAAHGGGYLPTAIGRSDRAWKVRPEAHGCAHTPPRPTCRSCGSTPSCTTSGRCAGSSRRPGPTGCCWAATSRSTWGSTTPSASCGARDWPRRRSTASWAATPTSCCARGCTHEDRAVGRWRRRR